MFFLINLNIITHTHRGHVYRRRGFVHDEDAALPHERSSQTEELPLTDAEVLSTFCHHRVWRHKYAHSLTQK